MTKSADDEIVLKAPLFTALDEASARSLISKMEKVRVAKGEVLFKEGQPGNRLYVVISGKLKLGNIYSNGRENILSILGPGDMFGELSLFDLGLRSATATAVTDSRLLSLSNELLLPLLQENTEVAMKFLQRLSQRLRQTNESLSDLVFSDVPGRVAKTLMDLGSRFGVDTDEGLLVKHDLTQEELAHRVGASRETVNKALADFAGRGWVKLEQRAVVILDRERMSRRGR